MKKPEIKKIIKIFEKCLRVLGKYAFFASLLLILIASIIGVFIFCKYSLLVEKKEVEFTKKSLWLEEDALQNILKELEEREIRFENAELEEYPDLFRRLSIEEELTE